MDAKQQTLVSENDLRKQLAEAQEVITALQEELEQTNKGLIALNIELEQREEKFRSIFETAQEGILTSGPDGRILSANPAAIEILGYDSSEELVGIPVVEIYESPEQWEPISYEMGTKGYIRNADVTLKKKDGTVIYALTSPSLHKDQEGNILGTQAIFADITERKLAEVQISKLNEELKHNIEQVEAANKELEAFSYSVSHDLRAPLRAIDGFSRILLEDYTDKLDDEGKRFLNVIRNNTQKMAQLIDDLLAFSRVGRQEINFLNISMTELAKGVFEDLKGTVTGQAIQSSINSIPNAYGDRSMIRQVFFNVLSNAIKFTRPKGTSIIEIRGWTEENENIYYVKDNGVGFDMQYVNKLFGVFQRLHSSEEFEGTGVGLAIVQRIIHRHGGRVWAEGKVGEGATFYFTLPNRRAMRDDG